MAKLDIANEMARFDQKDRAFYDSLDDDEKKKFSTYLMIRWGSCVSGDVDLQTYYLQMVNARLNKHFFSINKVKHDKLLWLLSTTVSPGIGNVRHNWISQKKKEGPNAKVRKFLATLYPAMKDCDLDLLTQLTDVAAAKKLAESMGMDKSQIKSALG